MVSPAFIIKRARDTDIKNWIAAAKRIAKKNGKNWIVVFKDMINCTIKYGAGYIDYETFDMCNLGETERENIMTVGKNNAFVRELNDPEKSKIFGDKAEFNKVFNDYVKREWLLLDGENFGDFEKLARDKKILIAKPLSLSCGSGIQKVELNEGSDLKQIYDKLISDGATLVEEVVVQCDEMAKLCTTSVNTVRMVTVRNGEKVTIFMVALRMGREGNFVDNFNYGGYDGGIGGLATIADPKTGKVLAPAYDKNRNTYEVVPVLGTKIVGFQIPKWNECVEFVQKAAMVVPEVRFIGWDVCISKDKGPLLIEGNEFPGNDLQLPSMNIGTYGEMLKALDRA